MSDSLTHELVVTLGDGFIVLTDTEDRCAEMASKIHDDWAKGNKGLYFMDGEGRMKSAMNLGCFQGFYTRRASNSVHERQVKAMEKLAKAAAGDGESWKGDDEA
jgi:hypothetical protein